VLNTKEDIRLGDITVNKLTSVRLGLIRYDFEKECVEDQFISTGALNMPSILLLTAAGKAEANDIFGDSQISRYISEIVQKEPLTFDPRSRAPSSTWAMTAPPSNPQRVDAIVAT
jgi:hypothetical protein